MGKFPTETPSVFAYAIGTGVGLLLFAIVAPVWLTIAVLFIVHVAAYVVIKDALGHLRIQEHQLARLAVLERRQAAIEAAPVARKRKPRTFNKTSAKVVSIQNQRVRTLH